MAEPFLSSDEYDERANRHYNEGQYEDAVALLREALARYGGSAELHTTMAYVRMAREEYAWARQSFERALALHPGYEDGMAGLGEVLLKLGERSQAHQYFRAVVSNEFGCDHDLLLQIGRALFRDNSVQHARHYFELAAEAHPESAEAAACVGYAAHRSGDEPASREWLERAIHLDPAHGEARIYLANILYDRGDYHHALAHLERTRPEQHGDELALWRLIEMTKSHRQLRDNDPVLRPWFDRLGELAGEVDATDLMLAELEAHAATGGPRDPSQIELFGTLLSELPAMQQGRSTVGTVHRVALPNGATYSGTFEEIVCQMREDDRELAGLSLDEYMAERARRGQALTGAPIAATDAETFIRASAGAGLLRILH